MIDYTEDEKKRRLFTIRYTAINIANIAAVIGPLLGVWIASLSTASTPFIITGIMYAVYGVFLFVVLNRYPSKQHKLSSKQRIQDIFIATAKNKTLLMLIIGAILISVGYSQFNSTLPQLIDLKIENAVQIFSYPYSPNDHLTYFAFETAKLIVVQGMQLHLQYK